MCASVPAQRPARGSNLVRFAQNLPFGKHVASIESVYVLPLVCYISVSSPEEDRAEADPSGGSLGSSADPASSLQLAGAFTVEPHSAVPRILLYKVSELGQPDTIHKFTTRYSAEAHSALAAQGLAPELLAPVEQLPGGWLWVRMQLMNGPWWNMEHFLLERGTLSQIEAAFTAVQSALGRAHETLLDGGKLVWGDARPNNVLLRWCVPTACGNLGAHAWHTHMIYFMLCAASAWQPRLLASNHQICLLVVYLFSEADWA